MTAMPSTVRELEQAALEIRKNLLKLCSLQNIHIGGDLSACDLMTVLWQYQMHYNPQNPQDESRDRFVLSKGHGSAVTSFCQAAIGCFEAEDIYREYATDTGRFSMHSCNLLNPYVEFSTGSLGHGLSVAAGMALGLRLKGNRQSRVYTVMGDGEQAEGSIWEAVMSASHYRLGNLVAALDYNGLGADGPLREITGLCNIAQKYRAFDWRVVELDGHDMAALKFACDSLPEPDAGQPSIFICHTTKGKGVSFMENQVRWHAGKVTAEQYEASVAELNEAFGRKWGASA